MAFTFPRCDPHRLFFPTVHVRRGNVPARASFDHRLYAQLAGGPKAPSTWADSGRPVGRFVDLTRAAGLVDGETSVVRRVVVGPAPNEDVWL